jgi:molecular chaperone GrpE
MSTQHTPGAHPAFEAAASSAGGASAHAATTSTDPASADEVMQAATARIAELEAEAADMKDRWMRAEAENQNIRTRSKREVDDTRLYAVQGFARDVAEAAETLRRGLDSIPSAAPGESEIVTRLREGFEGVERNMVAVLERHGVKREDPTGAAFDPNLHQAMAEQETDAHPPGTVLQAWTQAWTLHGRLLRPAMVVVAKAPTAELTGHRADGHINTTA